MKPLMLENPNQACITEFNTPGTLQKLEEACQGASLRRHTVDCGQARNKTQLLNLLAEALAFPDYFAANWDGLYDILCDDTWMDDNGVVLHLLHTDTFKHNTPHEWSSFYDALDEAIDYWRTSDLPFWVFLDNQKPAVR